MPDAEQNLSKNFLCGESCRAVVTWPRGAIMRDWDPEPRIKEWAASRGKGKEMAYAETYRVITLVSDQDWDQRKGCVINCDEED